MTISTLSPFMGAAFPGAERPVDPSYKCTSIGSGAELGPGRLAAQTEPDAPGVSQRRDQGETPAALVVPARPAPYRRQRRAVGRLDNDPLRGRERPQFHRRTRVLDGV